jgi:hypothetical protein
VAAFIGPGREAHRRAGQVGPHARGANRLGVGLCPPVRLRPKVGDDGRGPPVGESGRAAAGWAGLGQTAAGLLGCGKEWAAVVCFPFFFFYF